MKNKIVIFITGVIVAASLAGCGSGSSSYKSAAATESYAEPAMEEESLYYSDDMYEVNEAYDAAGGAVAKAVEKVDDSSVENSNRKIIKTVNISAETEEFDTFIANVDAKVKALGGYMESTNISGRSINAYKGSLRDANITARIPSNNLDSFVSNVASISNITNKSESAEDVTLNYADTEAHIKSLRTEQERLDQLLLQADDIETIIAIESRITDVRYELESYESRLRSMDNKVDYSTVYIYVNEVERYTPIEEPEQTIGQRILIGFTENMISAKEFVVDFFVGLIVSIPILVVLVIFVAIPVVIIFFLVRFIIGLVKGPEYREEVKAKRADKKAKKAQAKAKKAAVKSGKGAGINSAAKDASENKDAGESVDQKEDTYDSANTTEDK